MPRKYPPQSRNSFESSMRDFFGGQSSSGASSGLGLVEMNNLMCHPKVLQLVATGKLNNLIKGSDPPPNQKASAEERAELLAFLDKLPHSWNPDGLRFRQLINREDLTSYYAKQFLILLMMIHAKHS